MLGPLVCGLLTLGYSYTIEPTFESTAIIRAGQQGQQVAALFQTIEVADALIAEYGLLKESSDLDSARNALKKRLKVTFNAKESSVSLITSAASPELAQKMARSALNLGFLATQPKGKEKSRFEDQLKSLQKQAENLDMAFAGLAEKMAIPKISLEPLSRGFGEISRSIAEIRTQIIGVEVALEGLNDSSLIQAPNLPTQKVAPKKGMIALIATLASGFALLLFVFVRKAIQNAQKDPLSAEKMHAILRAFMRSLGLQRKA